MVPQARVDASGSGTTNSVTTDGAGRYTLSGVAPGTNRVRVTAAGFSEYATELTVPSGAVLNHDITLTIAISAETITVTDTSRQLDIDSSSNAGALVVQGKDLAALSDDPDDLAQDLQALAGPSSGPNGAEIHIDGFTGGKLPPKSAIREIRVNQNPFSAEFDRLGYGRVEVFTKPGTDRFRGEAFFNFGDAVFNARNPYATARPGYQRRMFEGNVGGPLSRRASFFAEVEQRNMEETSVINASVVDPSFSIVRFQQAVLTPTSNTEANLRIDYQLGASNTLVGRYDWEKRSQRNSGLNAFTLPERAVNSDTHEHVLQLTDTAMLSPTAVHEVRMQFAQMAAGSRASTAAPAVQVPDAFSGGGSPVVLASSDDHAWELTDVVSLSRKGHVVKFGGRLRILSRRDESMQNFNGAFTFTSMDAYRITEMGLRNGLSPDQIRSLGGGASQFTMTTGEPVADVKQVDGGMFIQDDWRVRPAFTITSGLRYEIQDNIRSRRDMAPRVGFAWAPGGKQPIAIIRGGFGMFYDRVPAGLTLDVRRMNGETQVQYIVADPNFYSIIPPVTALGGRADEAIRVKDGALRSPYVMQTAFSIERQLPGNMIASVTYMHSRGVRMLRSRNINAPLPGTYDPTQPVSGLRSYPGADIYLYESAGLFRQNQVIVNMNARMSRRFSAFGYYTFGSSHSDSEGPGSFPANQFDLRSEYGRAGFDVRHRVFIGGSISAPYGCMLSPFIVASSGPPYNITTGSDLNGDSLFNDRPAWATDLSRPSVVLTPYGAFDTAPLYGQKIIPRNLGRAPGMFVVNMRLSKAFTFGREPSTLKSAGNPAAPAAPAMGLQGGVPHGSGGSHGHGHDSASSGSGRYTVTVSASARNLLNSVNPAVPIGTLSSPRFGESVALAGMGHHGGGTSANRSLELQVRFSF